MKIWLTEISYYDATAPDLAPAAMTACAEYAQFVADGGVSSMALSGGELHVTTPATISLGAYTASIPVTANRTYSGELLLRGSGTVVVKLKFKDGGGVATAEQSRTLTLSSDPVMVRIEGVAGGGCVGGQIIIRSAAATPTEWYASQFRLYGGVRVLRYCSGRGFITRPTENPDNTAYQPKILQPALVRRDLPIPGVATTATRLSYGELTLTNADGALDLLTGYDFSGRTITIRSGEDTAAYPGGFTTQLVAVVDAIRVGMKEVTVKIKSPRVNWEQPIATATYGGTNDLNGNGVDGDSSLAGTAKPIVLGTAYPVAPVLVNAPHHIYQYNVPAVLYPPGVIDPVFHYTGAVTVSDGGLLLVPGTTYATYAEMAAETEAQVALWPAGVDYRLCPTGGLFRLKIMPSFKLSCRLTPLNYSVWDCLVALVNGPGGTAGAFVTFLSAAAFLIAANLNVLSGGVIASGKSLAQLLDELLLPLGCWWGFTSTGALRVGHYYYDLTRASALNLTLQQIITFDRDAAPLFWRVLVRNNHNVAVHSATEMAPAALAADKQIYATAWNETALENLAFKARHPAAGEYVAETMLYGALGSLATIWPGILQGSGAGREILKLTCRMDAPGMNLVDLGSAVTVTMPRLGYAAGKQFLVCGLQTDAVKNRVDLTLWG